MPLCEPLLFLVYLAAAPILGALLGWQLTARLYRRRVAILHERAALLQVTVSGYWARLTGYDKKERENAITLTGVSVESLLAQKAAYCRRAGRSS
jgi:2-methylcitrate dehydratase PrpD